jgi:hypothetical protein
VKGGVWRAYRARAIDLSPLDVAVSGWLKHFSPTCARSVRGMYSTLELDFRPGGFFCSPGALAEEPALSTEGRSTTSRLRPSLS